MLKFLHRRLLDAAGADGAAPGGAPAAAAPAAAAPAAAPASAPAASPAPAGSLLAQGVTAAAAPAANPLDWLHEQNRVIGENGQIDEAASIRRQAEQYAPLAKRMREVGAPPKSADEYTFEVPEALQGKYDPATDERLGEFRQMALDAGLSQKQFQAMATAYASRMPELAESVFAQSIETGERVLRETWKSDEQYTTGLRNAAAAVTGFDPAAFDAEGNVSDPHLRALMNNPYFLKMAAHFGAQMQEDTSPGSSSPAGASPYRAMSRAQLESHEAYTNARHPDHATVSRLVQEAYHRETGEALPT